MENLRGNRIYISPCGIGLGHISRCGTLAKELIDRGADVLFSTYLEGLEYARLKGFKVASAPALSLVNDETGSIDLKASGLTKSFTAVPTFLKQVQTEIRYLKKFRPDIILSDSRLSSVYAGQLLDIPIALILNQFQPIFPREDENSLLYNILDGVILGIISRGWGQSDIILIPDFPEPYTISMDSLRIPEPFKKKIQFVGAFLDKKPDEVSISNEIRDDLKIQKDQKFIYAGISGPQSERLPLIQLLKDILTELPEKYRIVMSLGDPTGGMELIQKGSLTMIPWIKDRNKYLKACDLVLSRAGHETIMQSICYNKPSLLIPVSRHTEQYANARRAAELGVAEALNQNEISSERLLEKFQYIEKNNLFQDKLCEMNDENALCNGVENTIKEIRGLLNN